LKIDDRICGTAPLISPVNCDRASGNYGDEDNYPSPNEL
jgi:hypothetical protein